MLSVSNAMSAGDASTYFSKEDYYLKGGEASQWLGTGAETLGLIGVVTKESFLNVCEGYTPDGGQRLIAPKITKDGKGNQVESHRAGNDLTFSAPKSVSIAYAAGVGGVKDAHDAAVLAIVSNVEAHYSQARTPDGIQNGSLVAAKFDHVTSRAIDPQLHSHCFVENMTQTPDGQWRANEPKNIFVDQKTIGLLYRQELMHQLQKSGFEIQFTDREQMLFEIKGVNTELIQEFSKRREAIEAKVAEWKAGGEHKGVPEARLYEMAALDTRDRKVEINKSDVERKWEQGFEAAGTTREQVRVSLESAREQVLEAQRLHPTEPDKSTAEIAVQAAAFLTDKEAVMDRALLIKATAQISGGQHSLQDLNASIDGHAGRENGIERMGQTANGRNAGREFYTTTEMRELEARNIEALKELEGFKSTTSRPEVEAYLAGLARETKERLLPEQAEFMTAYVAGLSAADRRTTPTRDGRVILTPGQREHVINELAGTKGFAVTQGDPGTGKTFASEIVERFNAEVLEPSGRGHYTLNVAYTGKAAMEMSAASGKPAYTNDSFLNRYRGGKVQIDTSNQVRERDRAVMNRGGVVASTIERHVTDQMAAGENRYQAERITGPEGPPSYRVLHLQETPDKVTTTRGSIWDGIAKGTTAIQTTSRSVETKWEGRESGAGFSVLKSSIRDIKPLEPMNRPTGQDILGMIRLAPETDAQISPVSGERGEGDVVSRENNDKARQGQRAKLNIAVPAGSQIVLKVDEASFVGARHAEHLLNVVKEIKVQGMEVKLLPVGDTKQLPGIQAGPFFVQAVELAKQGYGDFAAMKEISRQKNPELLHVVETLNRDDNPQLLGENAKEALGMLLQQGRVTEISDREQLVKATVSCYMSEANKPSHDPLKATEGEKQSVLLITALNADRHQLNREIREARITAGEIERGTSFEILTPERQGVTTGSYQFGQVVYFTGERNNDGRMEPLKGTRLNAIGEVQSVNPEKNTVTVRYEMDRRDPVSGETVSRFVTNTFDATEMAAKTTLFNREQREFSERDRIVLLKNDKTLGVENGNTGFIKSLDDVGNVTVNLESGREVSFNFENYAHIDHGYAVTVHKSQGATIDSVIMFGFMKPGAENEQKVLESMSGVSMTGSQYTFWNTNLSEFEKDFQTPVTIGGHAGNLEIVLLQDAREGVNGVQKGVAIRFENGMGVVKDEETRLAMREAGMHWVPGMQSWVTSVANDKAAELMDAHPLATPEYIEHLKGEFAGKDRLVDSEKSLTSGEEIKQVVVDTAAELERFGRASANMFNVAASRERYENMLMVNSVSGLVKAIQVADEKTTTVGKDVEQIRDDFSEKLAEVICELDKTIQGDEKEVSPDGDPLSQSIRELQEMQHEPGQEQGQDIADDRQDLDRLDNGQLLTDIDNGAENQDQGMEIDF